MRKPSRKKRVAVKKGSGTQPRLLTGVWGPDDADCRQREPATYILLTPPNVVNAAAEKTPGREQRRVLPKASHGRLPARHSREGRRPLPGLPAVYPTRRARRPENTVPGRPSASKSSKVKTPSSPSRVL